MMNLLLVVEEIAIKIFLSALDIYVSGYMK